MEVLYKYINRKHCQAFFERGSIKLGTLFEYQDVEAYGSVIGDGEEGTEKMITRFKDFEDHTRYYEEKNAREQGEQPNLTFVKGASVKLMAVLSESEEGMVSTTFADNCYIYCATKEFNRQVMEEFKCDACIEITAPDKFFEAISKAILDKGTFLGYSEIVYKDRLSHHASRNTIAKVLMKPPRYRNQKEVRAIWEPKGEIDGAIHVNVPDAIQYCRLHV